MQTVTLHPHPATPCPAVRALTVAIARERDLLLTYELRGDLAALAIPTAAGEGFADDLWRHTCFEAFIAPGHGAAYHELNFSPSGRWAVYAFASYRQRVDCDPTALAPTMSWRHGHDHLTLTAAVPLPTARRLGLSAVIETGDGGYSYWALHHPAARPDFHHADGFALRLESC